MKSIIAFIVLGLFLIGFLILGLPSLSRTKEKSLIPSQSKAAVEKGARSEKKPSAGSAKKNEKMTKAPEGPGIEKIKEVETVRTFEANYLDGDTSGLLKVYGGGVRQDLKLRREGFLLNETEWDQRSGVVRRRFYIPPNQILIASEFSQNTGRWNEKMYYPDGLVWCEIQTELAAQPVRLAVFSQGESIPDPSAGGEESQGVFKAYGPSGELLSSWSQSSKGERVLSKAYYKDGTVSAEWTTNQGVPDGDVRFYSPGGKMVRKIHFERGILHGASAFYYTEGGVRERCEFERGLISGEWKGFYSKGTLWYESHWLPGKRVKGFFLLSESAEKESLLRAEDQVS